ncbi:MAG TPA: hypothetical protein VI078_08750 [bacterium]
MEWFLGFTVAAIVAILLYMRFVGPPVSAERVADADADLVRERDRESWRRQKLRNYRLDKRHDDFYRTAAFRKAVAGGASEAEARLKIRREFPFYYADPAERDTAEFAGEDGCLPVVLRARIDANARIIKPLMESEGERFRTMNALIRACIRKGGI